MFGAWLCSISGARLRSCRIDRDPSLPPPAPRSVSSPAPRPFACSESTASSVEMRFSKAQARPLLEAAHSGEVRTQALLEARKLAVPPSRSSSASRPPRPGTRARPTWWLSA